MKKRRFRWGIIGIGKIAHTFANDLFQVPHFQIYAVASNSIERAKSFSQKFDVPHTFSSYSDILSADLDAIYIATRHPQHYSVAVMCLEKGIPVLCEKPLAMNSAEVKEMIKVSKKNDVFLMEAIWTRFLPSIVKLKEIIDRGDIGEVISVKANFGFTSIFDPNSRLFNKKDGGGALLDIGIYPLFLAQLFLGKPNQLRALASFSSTGIDEEIGILCQYPNGKLAHLQATIRAETSMEAEIVGTKGQIKLDSRWHEAKGFEVICRNGETRHYQFDFAGAKGLRFEAIHAADCIIKGLRESPLLPLQFSQDLTDTMDKIRKEIGLVYNQDLPIQ